MTWKEFVSKLIIDYCNNKGSRTFTLQSFMDVNLDLIHSFRPSSKTPENTTRRIFQELRDDGLISFVNNSGTYTLRGIDLLNNEVNDKNIIEIQKSDPKKREYLIETFARNRGWVKEAKDKFGCFCLYPKCTNSFLKQNGEPYIEVHHIISLCDGGEDGIWNLATLCAHHHRIAHYASDKIILQMQDILLNENSIRLSV